MRTVLAGIDEAGYGPLLGPLCIGMSVMSVRQESLEASVPNLWKLLESGVCREPGRSGERDSQGRIAVADSKALKLANSVKSTHPLIHLERGVLSFLGLGQAAVLDDATLFEALGAARPGHRAYAGAPTPLPVAMSAGELGICVNMVRRACERAGAVPELMRCRVVDESEFNRIIASTGNKAETTAGAVGEHLRALWEAYGATEHAGLPSRLGVVCDRLGGRASYAGLLERELPGTSVEVIEETESRSRYVVTGDGRRAGVSFMIEGESAHLPVALASMIAKYVRELLMKRFNDWYCATYRDERGADLKPTAGYALDARRWLDDVGETMTRADRAELVRRA
ncbi:MAG: hypothetical protein ACOYN0_01475 [Phycisphaerales bacterium]